MEVEPQVQASQVQPEPTPIDAAESNRRRLQEIEDQANLLLQMEKSCKVEAYKGSVRGMDYEDEYSFIPFSCF